MKKEEKSMKNKRVVDIAFAAVIIAVMAILNFVPNVGYIKIIPGAFEITIIHIFVIIFAWLLGWKAGLLSGTAFGAFCLINAYIIGNPTFQNPFVAVLPRIIFGFLTGLIFDLTRLIKRPKLRYIIDVISCGVVTVVHTMLVLIMIYLAFKDQEVFQTYMKTMLASMVINFPVEVAAAMVICPLVILGLDKAFPRHQAVYHGTVK